MVRHVVSVLRGQPSALRPVEPSLEANAYAVAEDVDLAVVLRGAALELALPAAEVRPERLAGVALPASAASQDLRGLVESGVRVIAGAGDLAAAGLVPDDLAAGVEVVDEVTLAAVIRDAEGVLLW